MKSLCIILTSDFAEHPQLYIAKKVPRKKRST